MNDTLLIFHGMSRWQWCLFRDYDRQDSCTVCAIYEPAWRNVPGGLRSLKAR